MFCQLKYMDRELEVDEAARAQASRRAALRLLMAGHSALIFSGVSSNCGESAGHPENALDHHRHAFTSLRGSEHRSCSAEGHVLPRPCFFALIRSNASVDTTSMPLAPSGRRRVSTSYRGPAAVGTLSAAVIRLASRLK